MNMAGVDPLVGQLLDERYRVRSRIASGGMATVYVGHDMKLDRTVALKVMHANLAADEEFIRRFAVEAKSAAALSHPNVVAVYDQGTDQGRVYLAMEYVPGRTLRDLLTARGRVGPREALQIMQPVLSALGAAHRAGLIHRDVKPENVLLTDDRQVKVADFGLARAESASKQTKTGMLIGTVGYVAPEQVVSGNADARSDVYAAGIMLFELITGRQPHQGETPLSVAYKHVNERVPLPSSVVPGMPPQLDALVAAATNHDPARRPSDAGHLHTLVGETLRALPPDIDARLAPVAALPPPMDNPNGATQTFAAPNGPQTSVLPQYHRPPPSAPRPAGGALAGLKNSRVAVIAGVLAVVMLLGGWVLYSQTIGNNQKVPNLVGMSESAAQATAQKAGLKVKLGPARYDDKVGADKVAEVQPGPGHEVDKGTLLTLIMSKGRMPVPVPNVAGQPAAQAQQALKQAGFDSVVSQEASNTVPRDQVIRTDPAAGRKVSPDDKITVVVSTGIKLPDLKNMSREEAAQALQSLGLQVTWQEQDAADGQPENTVLSTNPPAGSPVNRGDNITVVVTKKKCGNFLGIGCDNSNDNSMVNVPNLVGQPVFAARQQLKAAGFNVRVQGHSRGYNTVKSQNPPGGQAPKGDTITLYV